VPVVVFEERAVGAVDVRGASPATRDTDLHACDRPAVLVDAVAVVGGSNYGLDVAGGVMCTLGARRIGLDTEGHLVPKGSGGQHLRPRPRSSGRPPGPRRG
jgi:L-aminopeptidase/D-esterase-like protein